MSAVTIRRAEPRDADQIMALAPRLAEDAAPWRPAEGFLAAARLWLAGSVERMGDDHPIWVAELDARVVGVASAAVRDHFTGQRDCYLGELAVEVGQERRGIGRQLVGAVEDWARQQGLVRVTLDTGASHQRARAFYAALGYVEEQVQLTKLLD